MGCQLRSEESTKLDRYSCHFRTDAAGNSTQMQLSVSTHIRCSCQLGADQQSNNEADAAVNLEKITLLTGEGAAVSLGDPYTIGYSYQQSPDDAVN
jgi:hypothetical protein